MHLIGGFEEVSLQVWPGSSALIVNFQIVVSALKLNDWTWICCELVCSLVMVALYQKVIQIWLVIPFLCVRRLFTLYGQERRSFTCELPVFLDIIPEGILMETHIPFLMDLWSALAYKSWLITACSFTECDKPLTFHHYKTQIPCQGIIGSTVQGYRRKKREKDQRWILVINWKYNW